MSSTKVNSSLQCIKVGIHISMTDLHIIFSSGKCRSSLCLETPCTAIDTCKIFLNDSIPINNHIIFCIKVQTLLVRLDNKILSFYTCRIIVYHSTISGRACRSCPNGIHPSIQIARTRIFIICGKRFSPFSHINLIHHLMVALTVNTDIPALTQFRCHTFERNLQFGIGKCIGRFIGREKIISGRLISVSRTFFFASIIPRSGAITGIYIFQPSYNNIGSRINIYPKCILRTRIELGQTDVEVGKYPFTCSAIQHKRYFIGIT